MLNAQRNRRLRTFIKLEMLAEPDQYLQVNLSTNDNGYWPWRIYVEAALLLGLLICILVMLNKFN